MARFEMKLRPELRHCITNHQEETGLPTFTAALINLVNIGLSEQKERKKEKRHASIMQSLSSIEKFLKET